MKYERTYGASDVALALGVSSKQANRILKAYGVQACGMKRLTQSQLDAIKKRPDQWERLTGARIKTQR